MRVRIIKIGNSKGIRIPKPILEQTGITEDVELDVENNHIIIRPISNPRVGWDIAFKTMSKRDDDKLLQIAENTSKSWDEEEWQW
ncbi:MAG: AbrB/MazE/SpoVT family DNA-binding domain-containing protein [Candidatus Aegiribacteria sp.]|nr:AbrB/MazE/SpoVT family DNA-binding domain-containing protein [Candidatus Aegiribacteria sp.]